MSEVIIYRGEQRTPEWYALRAGRPTSSMFKAIMTAGRKKDEESISRRNYRIKLATEILTGEPLPDDRPGGIRAIEDGIEREPLARLAYERHTESLIDDDVSFVWNSALGAGASCDGLVDNDGLIEAKCPTRPIHVEYVLRDRCPPEYEWQVQGELLVTERAWCDFVSYNPQMPPGLRLHIVRVLPDAKLQADLAGGIADFNRDVERTVGQLAAYMARRAA